MKKWRIYFTVTQLYSKIKISGVTVEVYIHEYLATKGIRRPKPNAFELTLMIGGA